MHTAADVLHDAVHLLGAMAHANGEHQERYQHRIGVERVTQQWQQAELPDHCHQRTHHDQRGAAHTAGVPVQHGGGDGNGGGKEQQDLPQAVHEVADDLGETGDVDLHPLRLEALAQGFQLMGEGRVVEGLAVRGLLQQRHVDNARTLVEGHKLTNLVGAFHVALERFQASGSAIVAVGHHRATFQALLGDSGPAGGRRPQRLHRRTVDARQQVYRVVELLQAVQVVLVVDATARIGHGDAHRVAQAGEFLAVLQIVVDERMIARDHLLEAGIERQARGLPAEQQGRRQAQQQHQHTVVEERTFQQRAGRAVEVVEMAAGRRR
ncbi:hypothetical protein D3C80_707260 [compost metagenome]